VANTETFTAPTKRGKTKNPEFKEIIVEKQPSSWGLADPIEDFQEQGYEIVTEGPRKVTMRIPYNKFAAKENEARRIADERLRSTDGLGRTEVKGLSAKEMADTLPDATDLDE